jgi:hypothetical protein
MKVLLTSLVLLLVVCPGSGAEEKKVQTPPETDTDTDSEPQIHGIFESILTMTEREGWIKLTLHPHFGDLTRHDYLRVPLGVRYGLTDRLEFNSEIEPYFSHGLGHVGFFQDGGLASVRNGVKYHFDTSPLPWPNWDTAVGADYYLPIGHPPREMTDGLKHFTNYVIFSHRLENHRHLRVFWGGGYDIVRETKVLGDDAPFELHASSVGVTGGFVYDHKDLSYTFETNVGTTRFTGSLKQDTILIRPGVVWRVPRKYTFNAKGQWLLGVGLRVQTGTDGTDFGFSGRARLNFDFGRWWKKTVDKVLPSKPKDDAPPASSKP